MLDVQNNASYSIKIFYLGDARMLKIENFDIFTPNLIYETLQFERFEMC